MSVFAALVQEDGRVVVAVDVPRFDSLSVRRFGEVVLIEVVGVQVAQREHALHLAKPHSLFQHGAGFLESSRAAQEVSQGLGATITGALAEEGLDHYAVGMQDPEGNEFDIN